MDLASNLPVKIDVFEIKDVTPALTEADIQSGVGFSYPGDFGMADLSPSSYAEFVQRIETD